MYYNMYPRGLIRYLSCAVRSVYYIYFSAFVYIYSAENEVTYTLYIILYYTYYCRVHTIFFVMNAADLRRSAHNRPMQRVRIIFVSCVYLYIYTYLRHIIIRVRCSRYTLYIQQNLTLFSYSQTQTREYL